jgi:peroxiredoxin
MLKQKVNVGCLLLAAMTLTAAPSRSSQGETTDVSHQYSPLREAKLDFKDFSFPTLENTTLNLRDMARGKRLVLVTYFASWCHNSNYDVPTLNELYAKYHEQGLEIIGICVYSSADELRSFIKQYQPAYPICREGDEKVKNRSDTTHHHYRQHVDDKRRWGTPFSVFIRSADMEERGETVAKRVRVVVGELIKQQVDEFIGQQLAVSSAQR